MYSLKCCSRMMLYNSPPPPLHQDPLASGLPPIHQCSLATFCDVKSLMQWGGSSLTKFSSWGWFSWWYGVPTIPPLIQWVSTPWSMGLIAWGYCQEHHSYRTSFLPSQNYSTPYKYVDQITINNIIIYL